MKLIQKWFALNKVSWLDFELNKSQTFEYIAVDYKISCPIHNIFFVLNYKYTNFQSKEKNQIEMGSIFGRIAETYLFFSVLKHFKSITDRWSAAFSVDINLSCIYSMFTYLWTYQSIYVCWIGAFVDYGAAVVDAGNAAAVSFGFVIWIRKLGVMIG